MGGGSQLEQFCISSTVNDEAIVVDFLKASEGGGGGRGTGVREKESEGAREKESEGAREKESEGARGGGKGGRVGASE